MRSHLQSAHNACSSTIRVQLQEYSIPHKHLNAMHAHFTSDVRKDLAPIFKDNTKKGVWERLLDRPFYRLFMFLH